MYYIQIRAFIWYIKRPPIIFLLPVQIAETHRMSILNAAIAVCRRRYGVLRFLVDYRLVLQSALCYAKQCDLIKNEKTFMDAMNVS